MVGNNPASTAYVNGKKRDCDEWGIEFLLKWFPEDVTQEEILNTIWDLNITFGINGILVQLPLPSHLDKSAIISAIAPEKDVDCFCESNIGKMFLGDTDAFWPCTPLGIIELLTYYNIGVQGKHCVVIGRSDIVGKPMATILTNLGATVTICNSHTKNLEFFTKNADIIICAVGKRNFLTANMVSEGVVVVDVGINRNDEGKLCGDADFEELKLKASAITPVPGGVGLMTRAALMINLAGTVAQQVAAEA